MSDPFERYLPATVVALGVLIAAVTVAWVLAETPHSHPEALTASSLRSEPLWEEEASSEAGPPASEQPGLIALVGGGAVPREVRLVVLVVFDQLRADLIAKPEWRQHFGPDGFRRLQEGGAWFTNCHYPYAITSTGPGHASMLTGAPPARTGIVNNEWYDRRSKAEAYCAGSTRFAIVPPLPSSPVTTKGTTKPKQVGAPTRLLAPTVADVLKRSTDGRGKVFGVSLKDRSGVLPSGKRPDGVFWFDGRFVTSTYYADAVPAWVADFNKSGTAESYFGKDWVRVRADLDYNTLAGPDQGEGEGVGAGQGVEFPHSMTGGKDKNGMPFVDVKAAGSKYYEALANSPFGNELLLAFAKKCIDEERLGEDDVPDLLTVSFSSNDLIGHTWGPDSHEVLDCTLRSDAVLAGLLAHLDVKVGKGKYAVVLTADHGICPLPEFAAKHLDRYPDAKDARRVPIKPLREGAEKHLQARFGNPTDPKSGWVEEVKPPYFYLNHNLIRSKGQTPAEVAEVLASWVSTQAGVSGAYSAQVLRGEAEGKEADPVVARVRQAYYPDRSGDVYVVLAPYLLFGDPDKDNKLPTGTTHGAPHAYDTHVPLLVYGPGVKGGVRGERVAPLHAASIAAKFLGVPLPAKAMVPLPATLAE